MQEGAGVQEASALSSTPLFTTPYQGQRQNVWAGAGDVPAWGSLPGPSLLLVGTVHGDPEGYGRAWRLLHYFRPQVVAVEISPFSVRYRERHGPIWAGLLEKSLASLPKETTRHLAIRRLRAQIAMPFEWQAAADYGRDSGATVLPLDLCGPARRSLTCYAREVLGRENLEHLLLTPDGSLRDFVSREFQRARASAFRPLMGLGGANQREAARREGYAARRLRNLAATGGRVLHVGGWEHLAPRFGGVNLFDLLVDLRPLRILLEEADRLPDPSTPRIGKPSPMDEAHGKTAFDPEHSP